MNILVLIFMNIHCECSQEVRRLLTTIHDLHLWTGSRKSSSRANSTQKVAFSALYICTDALLICWNYLFSAIPDSDIGPAGLLSLKCFLFHDLSYCPSSYTYLWGTRRVPKPFALHQTYSFGIFFPNKTHMPGYHLVSSSQKNAFHRQSVWCKDLSTFDLLSSSLLITEHPSWAVCVIIECSSVGSSWTWCCCLFWFQLTSDLTHFYWLCTLFLGQTNLCELLIQHRHPLICSIPFPDSQAYLMEGTLKFTF